MPTKVSKNQERAAEDAHRIAGLRRRALAEAGDILVLADEAEAEAGRAAPADEFLPEGTDPASRA
jgi:hypothetical protein